MKKNITKITAAALLITLAGCSCTQTGTQGNEPSNTRAGFTEESDETSTEKEPSLKSVATDDEISYIDYDVRSDVSCIQDFTEDYFLYRTDYSYDIIKIKDERFPELKRYFDGLAEKYKKELEDKQQKDIEEYSRLKEDLRPKVNRTIRLEVVRSDSDFFSFFEITNFNEGSITYAATTDDGEDIYTLHTLSSSTGKELEIKDILRKDMSELDKALETEAYEDAKHFYEFLAPSDKTKEEFTADAVANIKERLKEEGYSFQIKAKGVEVADTLIPYSEYPGLFLTEDRGIAGHSILLFGDPYDLEGDLNGKHILNTSDTYYTVTPERSEDRKDLQTQKNNNLNSPSGTDKYEELPAYDSVKIDINGKTESIKVGDYDLLCNVYLTEKEGSHYLYLKLYFTDPVTYEFAPRLAVINIDNGLSIAGISDQLYNFQPFGDVIDPDRFEMILDSDITGSKYLKALYKVGENGMPVPSTGVYSFMDQDPVETVAEVTGNTVRDGVVTSEKKTIEILSYLIPYETDNSSYIDFKCEDGDIIRLSLLRSDGEILINGFLMNDILAPIKNFDWAEFCSDWS